MFDIKKENLDTFSTVMFVDECLLDEERTKAFDSAINEIVKPGDVVVDVGTGSGILALFAARAGAKKVHGVEIDEDSANLARKSIERNRVGEKVEIVVTDAASFVLEKPADVVTMELMDTGLIAEQQAVVMNALRKSGVIAEHTKLIPNKVVCAVELVNYDFDFYGFDMPLIIQARNNGATARVKEIFSNKVVYQEVDFSDFVDTKISNTINIISNKTGSINAVMLTTQAMLSPRISIWGTTDMNMPAIFPIQKMDAEKGKTIELTISYEMGRGFGEVSISAQNSA